jgi:O-antigen biosynthesis protein WbqV
VQIKPIAIEDLLGRPQSTLDQSGMHTLIRGKCVLITGCGGSIGSELVRQIASYAPQKIILIDHSEYLLYCIDQEIGEAFPSLSKVAYIADVGDRARIFELFQKEKPELVFHAAALKHVPIVEENPLEGIETNTLGTKNVADASRHHHVNTMVLISTDKAINPTNIMGATKRLAESYCQSLDVLDTHRTNRTRYVTVRFGNVLGSTGSVVPLFKHQIEQGGPVTVTHPDITRYFMTIREAVALVLQAAAFGSFSAMQGGKIFVLDMGEPVRVVDLAHQMIHLAGLQPNVDIKIEFTGLRPGEKLYEELFHSHESLTPTTIPNLLLGSPRIIDHKDLIHMLEQLTHALQTRHADDAMRLLCAMVPEFVPGDHLGLSA